MAVVVPIVTEWNPKGLERAIADIEKAETGFGKVKSGLESAFLPASIALAGIGGSMIVAAENAAGLEQAMKKVEHVFGSAGDELVRWSEDAPTKLGETQEAALKSAFIFGQFGEAAGLAGNDLADFSKDLVTLGSDLAAIEGVSTGQALDAIASGLRGSYEPLRQFGILLSEAEVKAKALELGLSDGTSTLDSNARAIAAQALILEDGAYANGFFADSAGNLLVEQQKLKATFEQTSAELGEAFVPAMETIVGLLSSFATWARDNKELFETLVLIIGGFAAAIVGANIALKAYEGFVLAAKIATLAWEGVQWLLNAALNANPLGLIAIAVVGLTTAVIAAYENCDWFREIVDKAWEGIKSATEAVFPIIQTVIETVWEVLKRLFEVTPVGLVIQHWDDLKEATSKVWEAIQNVIETVVGKIRNIIDSVTEKIAEAIRKVKEFASNIPFIGGLFNSTGPQLSGGDYLLNASSSPLAGSGPSVVVNVNAGVGDPVAIARAIEATLRTRNMRLGLA